MNVIFKAVIKYLQTKTIVKMPEIAKTIKSVQFAYQRTTNNYFNLLYEYKTLEKNRRNIKFNITTWKSRKIK